MVRHVFLYKVASSADPKKVIEILNTLPKRSPGFAPGRWVSIKARPELRAIYGITPSFATSTRSKACKNTPTIRTTWKLLVSFCRCSRRARFATSNSIRQPRKFDR